MTSANEVGSNYGSMKSAGGRGAGPGGHDDNPGPPLPWMRVGGSPKKLAVGIGSVVIRLPAPEASGEMPFTNDKFWPWQGGKGLAGRRSAERGLRPLVPHRNSSAPASESK